MGLPMFVSPPLPKRQLPSKQSDSADSDTSRTRGDSEDRHRRRSFPYNIVQQHIHRLQQLQYLHRTRDMSSFNQNARRSLQSAHLLGQSRVHMVPGVYNPNITAGNGLHYGFIPQRLRIERRQRSGDGSNRIRDDGMMMDESDGNGNPSINTQTSPRATIQPSEPSSTTVPSTPTIPSSPSPSDDVIRRVTLIRQNQRRPRFRLLSPVSSRNTTANGNTSNGSYLPSNQSSILTSPSSPHTTNGRNESFITQQLALTPLSISLAPAILSSHIANGNVNEIDRRQYGDGVGWGESSGYYGHSNNTTGTTTGQNQTSSSPSLSSLAPLSPTLLSLNQAFPLSAPHSHIHSQNFTSHSHTIPLAPHSLHSFSTSADSHRILSPIPRRYTTYPDALAATDFDVPEDTAFLFDDGTSAELVTVANNEIEEFGPARSSASGECC
ncbi:9209_t:CDS:2 [Paraglomus brasilianum]|uniref:9209_t:CDS:1 n=1 Tax=Paraglomus brasilianum TaxID=144538 RepID=A0A9N9BAC9_9GLOM|nr:9209_t:CDS:2 [Paraglomus brasilianum]